MTSYLHVLFRDMPRSEALEADVGKHAARLERLADRIGAVNVTIQATTRRKQRGSPYSVHVEVKVPGVELVSNRHADADAYVAVRDAFAAVERGLQAVVDKRREEAKRAPRAGTA